MKVVPIILRILSLVTFIAMCYLVYNTLSGHWDWDAPYIFIVTIFRLMSMVFFFFTSLVFSGLVASLTGSASSDIFIGLYNTLLLRMWYMQPFGLEDPLTDINAVYRHFTFNLDNVWLILQNNTFTFLYFLFAALGVAFFLQSMFRIDHKFVGGAFLSIQAILIVGAFRLLAIPNFIAFPADFMVFFVSNVQILAIVSFAYLEISYQMLYSQSVGKPVEEREETLKKQLLALRQATRKQDAIERGDKVSVTTMSRSTSATAFSFLREAIERKVVGDKDALENLDAVSDVRRLQIYVDELLESDENAREELTAKAAAPSESYVITSTLTGSIIRFAGVVVLAFIFMSPVLFVSLLNLPPGVAFSLELEQPEMVVFFLMPIILLFPLIAMIIGWSTTREALDEIDKEEEEEEKKERRKKLREAAKLRRKREAERKKVAEREEPTDEWDRALEESFKIGDKE